MKTPNFSLPAKLLGAVFTMLALTGTAGAGHNTPEALEARTMPVGQLNVVAANSVTVAAAAGANPDGEKVYGAACAACHGIGIAGAPKTGDAGAWAARIAKGIEALAQNAINGFQGETGVMPAKGGNPALSDGEVEAAVKYMVESSR